MRRKRDERLLPDDDRADVAAEDWLKEFRPVRPDALTAADRDARPGSRESYQAPPRLSEPRLSELRPPEPARRPSEQYRDPRPGHDDRWRQRAFEQRGSEPGPDEVRSYSQAAAAYERGRDDDVGDPGTRWPREQHLAGPQYRPGATDERHQAESYRPPFEPPRPEPSRRGPSSALDQPWPGGAGSHGRPAADFGPAPDRRRGPEPGYRPGPRIAPGAQPGGQRPAGSDYAGGPPRPGSYEERPATADFRPQGGGTHDYRPEPMAPAPYGPGWPSRQPRPAPDHELRPLPPAAPAADRSPRPGLPGPREDWRGEIGGRDGHVPSPIERLVRATAQQHAVHDEDAELTRPLPVILPGANTVPRPAPVESPRGPFEAARPAQPAESVAVRPASITGSVEPPPAPFEDRDPGGRPQMIPAPVAPPESRDIPRAAEAKLDQIKDLYLTAEAIGEDALDKHFEQVSQRQRQLIREFFERSGPSGTPG